MSQNELMVVSTQAFPAVAERKGSNYVVTSPLTGNEVKLDRNTDFGVVPKTKKPSLYKSGAEKIIMSYGLMCRYSVESKMEIVDKAQAVFGYVFKCSLYKGFTKPDGTYQEVEYANGYGAANTSEKRNGYNSAYDSLNGTIKMAQKRAMVQAALSVSGLSAMFSQDMEDETGVSMQEMIEQKPTDVINSQQRTRMGNVAANAGMTTQQFGKWLSAEGYPKSSQITVKQFDEIIEKLQKIAKGE